ncbi:MAG: hypothetical protein Q8S73_05900 [Deltaproteobacteria bacterium]|nr:hypothetical protein [Myxococcales bacterium]MDP3213616.1 hypothetical protein [Deltaproteobacteria bacterium]
MSERVGRAVATVVLVVGIPLACLAGIALYGKALSESDVAIGTLVPPEVARRRFLEARARFLALSPAEHLAAAEAALDAGAGRRRGGGVGAALEHLGAIPPGVPERARADAMLAEFARRRREALRGFAVRLEQRIREQGEPSGADAARLAAMRAALAASLGSAQVEGDGGVTLRLERRRCDGVTLDAVAAPNAPALRALGFREVRCATDGGVLAL